MIKFCHYWLALGFMILAAFELPDYEAASYNILMAILNLLFSIFWSINEN